MLEVDILSIFQTFNKQITLPDSTIEIVHNLNNLVTSPNYSKVPQFKKKKLKSTQLPIATGIKKDINVIRSIINKITIQKFDSGLEKLKLLLNNIDEKDKKEVCTVIFTLASTNKFFSYLYAKLFIELDKEFSMKHIFDDILGTYMTKFKPIDIIHCDNYDVFCTLTKQNEENLALSDFYTNLMILDYLSTNIIIEILNKLLSNIESLLDKDNNNLIDQLSENVFVIVKTGKNKLVMCDTWNEFFVRCKTITKLDKKDNKGLTHKSKFKFMDIIDLFKK
jgi:hypothetical protein